jgi:hypothetical protein
VRPPLLCEEDVGCTRFFSLVQIAGTFDLIPPVDTSANASNAYVGAMDVHVSGDAALETYCRGGRTLSVCSPCCKGCCFRVS